MADIARLNNVSVPLMKTDKCGNTRIQAWHQKAPILADHCTKFQRITVSYWHTRICTKFIEAAIDRTFC